MVITILGFLYFYHLVSRLNNCKSQTYMHVIIIIVCIIFPGVVLAIAVALLVGGLLVVAFFTAAIELVIDDVSIGIV